MNPLCRVGKATWHRDAYTGKLGGVSQSDQTGRQVGTIYEQLHSGNMYNPLTLLELKTSCRDR